MDINKVTILKFIYRGTQYRIHCKFINYFLEKVPVFESDNVDKICIIQLKTGDIMIVGNKKFIDSLTDTQYQIYIWHNLLEIYFNRCKTETIKDICVAYWFGFTEVINILKEMNDTNDRIKQLEKIMMSDTSIKIPSMDEVINSVKYVNVI